MTAASWSSRSPINSMLHEANTREPVPDRQRRRDCEQTASSPYSAQRRAKTRDSGKAAFHIDGFRPSQTSKRPLSSNCQLQGSGHSVLSDNCLQWCVGVPARPLQVVSRTTGRKLTDEGVSKCRWITWRLSNYKQVFPKSKEKTISLLKIEYGNGHF